MDDGWWWQAMRSASEAEISALGGRRAKGKSRGVSKSRVESGSREVIKSRVKSKSREVSKSRVKSGSRAEAGMKCGASFRAAGEGLCWTAGPMAPPLHMK